jgi:phage-related tail protein
MNGVLSSLGSMADDNRSKVDGALTSAQSSMEELDIALNTLNAHLAAILQNVESGSHNMNEFARSIRNNPARIIRNSATTEPGDQ